MIRDEWLFRRKRVFRWEMSRDRSMASMKKVYTHRGRCRKLNVFYEENLQTQRQMMRDTWLLTRDDLKSLWGFCASSIWSKGTSQKAPASSWEDIIKRAWEDPLEREAEKIWRIGKSQCTWGRKHLVMTNGTRVIANEVSENCVQMCMCVHVCMYMCFINTLTTVENYLWKN